jgi:hypothetical protein
MRLMLQRIADGSLPQWLAALHRELETRAGVTGGD